MPGRTGSGFQKGKDLLKMMKVKAEESIFGIFLCEDGDFRFVDQELPELDFLPLAVDINKAVLKVTQRLDEGEKFDPDASGSFAL
ncbi:MAG TPA: hypothetical protein VHL58_11140 [Thermoanaerobaculia bacterium]|nr:hypothetical protein [Thermoanaerobaculia bacterium]